MYLLISNMCVSYDDDCNMVLSRAERDYKGDMEALSLEIEQVL